MLIKMNLHINYIILLINLCDYYHYDYFICLMLLKMLVS